MEELKHNLLLGSVFGLLLFLAERCITGRIHIAAQPGGSSLTWWLLGTAVLYLGFGLLLGLLTASMARTRRRPWLAPHLGAVLCFGLTITLLPNWYAILLTASSAAILTHLLWALPWRRQRWFTPALGSTIALAALVSCWAHPRGLEGHDAPVGATTGANAPDIVLVVLDTVRRDRVSAYGYPRETTPALDQVASGGALIRRAYAPSPWSLPSHVTLFSGQSPSAHGAHYEHPQLDDQVETLATVLSRHGYRTVGISGNPWLSVANGSARGFQDWHDSVPVRDLSRCFTLRWLVADNLLRGKGGAETVEVAGRVADNPGSEPLFLFANIFETHSPYDQVPADCGRMFLPAGTSRGRVRKLSNRLELAQTAGTSYLPLGDDRELTDALYDGALRCADDVLGSMLSELESRERPALVMVTSDHGESLGEHQTVGHTHGLHDLLIHVPMAVRYPPEIPPGSTVDQPVRFIDVMPTLLDYAGVPTESWPSMEGRSVRSMLAGLPDPVEVEAFAEHFIPVLILDAFRFARPAGEFAEVNRRRRSVVAGDMRYEIDSRGETYLYDLGADPGENHNLATPLAQSEREISLQRQLGAWIEKTGGPWGELPSGVPETELDEATEERLRALGYMR